ncbi:hypothetical protein M1512_03490 [Patescibacteria group bacterium]|jgi:hypothetical protein|nr:hypothetical protein [Patescibacteria group bacterium]
MNEQCPQNFSANTSEEYPTIAAAVCAISGIDEALSFLREEAEALSKITTPDLDTEKYVGHLVINLAKAVNPASAALWAQAIGKSCGHRTPPYQDCKAHSSNQTPPFRPLKETSS